MLTIVNHYEPPYFKWGASDFPNHRIFATGDSARHGMSYLRGVPGRRPGISAAAGWANDQAQEMMELWIVI